MQFWHFYILRKVLRYIFSTTSSHSMHLFKLCACWCSNTGIILMFRFFFSRFPHLLFVDLRWIVSDIHRDHTKEDGCVQPMLWHKGCIQLHKYKYNFNNIYQRLILVVVNDISFFKYIQLKIHNISLIDVYVIIMVLLFEKQISW